MDVTSMTVIVMLLLILTRTSNVSSQYPPGLSYPELYMLLGTLSGMTGGAVLANRIVEEREEEEEEECTDVCLRRCSSDRCGGNGKCIREPDGDHFCICDPGYTGRDTCDKCEYKCIREPDGDHFCVCDPGYTGRDTCEKLPDPDPDICEGVDCGRGHCVTGQMDGVNSPVCVCMEGFVLEGGTCTCPEGTVLQSGTCVGCPSGSKTYTEDDRVICYFHKPGDTLWGAARDACKQAITHPNADDADLAVIPSVDAKNFINAEFQSELEATETWISVHYDDGLGMFVDATGNAITYENWEDGTEPVVTDANRGCVTIDGETDDFEWVTGLPDVCSELTWTALCSLELKIE